MVPAPLLVRLAEENRTFASFDQEKESLTATR